MDSRGFGVPQSLSDRREFGSEAVVDGDGLTDRDVFASNVESAVYPILATVV
jgi:hypothetical protein